MFILLNFKKAIDRKRYNYNLGKIIKRTLKPIKILNINLLSTSSIHHEIRYYSVVCFYR